MSDLDPMMPARVDFAWRCHGAQESWTSKADTKASILMTADLVGIAALASGWASPHGVLGSPGWHRVTTGIGIGLVGLAVIVTTIVIFPLLGPTRPSANRDVIYFGHLRGRSADAVAEQIAVATFQDQVDQLSRQLVAMARINWLKHRLLQLGLVLSVAGYVLAGVSMVG